MTRLEERARSESDVLGDREKRSSDVPPPSGPSVRTTSRNTLDADRLERLAAVGMFTTGMVHELLSPIASIRMAAQHAQEISDPDRNRLILAAIVEASDRCRRA